MIAHAFALAAVMLRLALVTLGLTGLLASALARAAEPPMANAQRKELTTVRQQWAQRCDPSSGAPNASGPAVARDSGTAPPVVQMRDVDFRITGDIGFHVHQLTAQLVPHKPGQPVDMDDPGQFDIRILGGEVTVPKESLDALFNRYLLDYSPRSLNALSLTPGDGVLDVSGGLKLRNHFPGVWLPFGMRGTLALKESRFLVYTPTEARVMGIQTLALLKRTGLELSQLAPLNRTGAKLDGNDMVLDQYTVFPPPRLVGQMKTARVTPDGLVLGFGPAPAMCAPAPTDAASRIWIQSGDLKMYNVLVANSRILVTDTSTRGPLRFDLYHYREAAARGTTRMDADGTLRVDLAPAAAVQ
ncbi:LmeA family phospholipid-binding protein [Ralstonia pickettii]|jgi:hypothetical protein|uniref:LmeA family phospholipid-binding protein n=3 Tax=Pseudomonadota TaxID=1224 RepID=UPI0001E6A312|nr:MULTISPECIES: LmeA family phospholipid-binding protein [Ralstonia]EFP66283.1 hypothetical protein HMPREF1004_01931 [Ralstonia pickettii]EGY65038.1 hypothetical protein HMPREF0989_01881 [Ralstonia sp. 5_2_56FAA]KFL19036.1 hypothetical protein DP23_3847 [Ralstonia pickettii]MBU6522522.1 LmeA family phospholipid-binding protein [Ralstonia sp. B265]NPT52338.1 DUF2993 domain-containing protein [Ralstonia sp. 3N]